MRWVHREIETRHAPDQVLFISLLILIGLASVSLGSIEARWARIFESAIFILGACSIITTVGKHWTLPFVLVPILALVLFACVQLLPLDRKSLGLDLFNQRWQTISLNPLETKRFAIRLAATALTLAMLLRFMVSRRQLLRLTQLVIIVGVVSAAFAIWRLLANDIAVASLFSCRLSNRGFGQFTNRNHFALLMEMSLGPTLTLGFYEWSQARRFLYFEIALLICVVLILTNSRGGIISMMGQLAFLLWIYLGAGFGGSFWKRHSSTNTSASRRLWRVNQALLFRCIMILLILGVGAAAIVSFGGESVRERLATVPGEFLPRTDNLQSQNPRRLEIWIATWKLTEAHPWLGSGLGAYDTAVASYLKSAGDWQPQQAHNEYLELAAGGGIVGVGISIGFVLIVIRESRRRLLDRDPLRRAMCVGALAGLVSVAIHSLVDFGLHVMANTLICCCLIAVAAAKLQLRAIES
jgi:O-antigen ligase